MTATRVVQLFLLVSCAAVVGCASGDERDDDRLRVYVHPFQRLGRASGLDHLRLHDRTVSSLAEFVSTVPTVRLVAPGTDREREKLRQLYELYCEQKGRALAVTEGNPQLELGGSMLVQGTRVELRGWSRRGEAVKERSVKGEVRSLKDAAPLVREMALTLLVDAFPKDKGLLMKLGVTYAQGGLPARAIAVYRKVLVLDPASPAAHFNLGLAHDRSGQPEKANAAYRKALEVRPDYQQALFNLALNHVASRRKGESEAALKSRFLKAEPLFLRLLEINPRHKEGLHLLAETQEIVGKYHEALETCRRIARIFPGESRAWRTAGSVCLRLKRYDIALKHFRKAAEFDPLVVANDFFIATALEKLGKEDDASYHYRRFIQLAGTDKKFARSVGIAIERVKALMDKRRKK